MEVLLSNALVEEKKKRNFYLPVSILDLFDDLCKPYSGKQKWLVATAAILAVAELSSEDLNAIIRKIAAADLSPGETQRLIEQAKAKRPRPHPDQSRKVPFSDSKPSASRKGQSRESRSTAETGKP